ncbi:MAG: hypothetical protein PUC18_01870 [Prevotellaceae bacterium]|nr:hypothetical protein [Bacteroidaceae bacterium]MDD6015021.1 hypothetical protein [Prevotellaceae bacterium]
MANYSLEIGNALNAAWEYAKKYGLLIAVIYLLTDLLAGGLDQISGPSVNQEAYQALGEAIGRQDWESAGSIAQSLNTGFPVSGIIGAILKLIVSVGLYNLALGLMAGRFSEVTFDAFKLPFATYLKVFVVNLITGIIVFVSVLCCIIPVFFVAPRIIFAPVYQVEHPEAGIFESISASWNMSSGNTFSLLGLGFIIVGIAIVGFCCCCIGVYFAEAIELFALTAAYYQLKGNLQ